MKHSNLWDVLADTQHYISKYYATALTDENKHDQLKAYIEKYILDEGFLVEGFTDEQLIDRLYSEMVEYSILTPFLGNPDLDEINVNSWDDIVLTWSDGRMEKLEEHFHTPEHAVDIVKRLLHHSGMIIDNATPIAQGHLPNNTRIDDIIARVESARKRNRNGFDGNGKVIRDTLKEFRRTNNINVWIEEDENGEMTLCATPRDIASKLRSALWDKPCSHLLTSGTVSDGTDFSFFLKENGLDRIPNSRMAVSSTPSPFDYENHTRLYIPKGIPAPDNNDGDYIQAIAEHVVDLVRATNGHTAILFTSYKVLSAVYGLTKDRLSDYDVICMTRSNKTAIGNFKKSKNGVLFASGSMWEGVDCIGDCLSSVIIVRLPFPLRSAMMEKKKQEIGDVRAFIQDYAVPEMLIKLRQGIGRLIRSETDTGLITILDPRVRSKAYAARIENILGKYPEAESLEEVREFFLQVKPSTYFEV